MDERQLETIRATVKALIDAIQREDCQREAVEEWRRIAAIDPMLARLMALLDL